MAELKILYTAYFSNSNISKGVISKINAKVKYLSNSADLSLIIGINRIASSKNNINIYNCEILRCNKDEYFDYMIMKSEEYDYILMRYPGGGRRLYKFLKSFGEKVLFEHNSRIIQEKRRRVIQISLLDYAYLIRKGKIKQLILPIIDLLKEHIYFNKCVRHSKGGIAITNQVRDEIIKSTSNINHIVVSNGIDSVNDNCKRRANDYINNYKMIMVCGSDGEWTGVDRLIRGLAKYKGNYFLTINLVGKLSKTNNQLVKSITNENILVNYLGIKYGEELSKLYLNHHMGIGSLGAYRIGMREMSSLKVREYWSHGLPVMICCKDTDIDNSESMSKYTLMVPNDGTSIDIVKVVNFLNKIYKDEEIHNKIIKSAKRISYEVKMNKLLAYIKELK